MRGTQSSDLLGNFHCEEEIAFGVDFTGVGLGMTQGCGDCLDAVQLPNLGARGVTELVRTPTVLRLPASQLLSLITGSSGVAKRHAIQLAAEPIPAVVGMPGRTLDE